MAGTIDSKINALGTGTSVSSNLEPQNEPASTDAAATQGWNLTSAPKRRRAQADVAKPVQNPAASPGPIAAKTADAAAWTVDAPTEYVNQPPFDDGIQATLAKRRLPAKIAMWPGRFLADSGIPVVKNVGVTLASVGQLASSPFTMLAGLVTADWQLVKDGAEDFARGALGILGLEHVVMDERVKTGGGKLTGTIEAPQKFAAAIVNARRELKDFTKTDEKNGMKGWHTLSNAKLASTAGITELPWIWLGGLLHEIDPGSAKEEIGNQTAPYWLLDSVGDLVANTMGIWGGVLLPEQYHLGYAKFMSRVILGPTDPWEGAAITSRNPDGAKTNAKALPAPAPEKT